MVRLTDQGIFALSYSSKKKIDKPFRQARIFNEVKSLTVGTASFDTMKQWIADFTANFDISPTTSQVALVQYSDSISVREELN